jgi:hypothetical protein
MTKELDTFQKHQKKIAIATLKMNDVGVSIMGGMTKAEARQFLTSIGYSENQIAKLEEQTMILKEASQYTLGSEVGLKDIVDDEFFGDKKRDKYFKDDILPILIDCIEGEFSLKKDGDTYYGKIEPDNDDELSSNQIKEILESKAPMEYFYDMISESFQDSEFDERDYIFKEVEKQFGGYADNYEDDDVLKAEDIYGEFEEEIEEWLQEHIYIDVDANHYLKQDIPVNLMIDSGDGNHDFTLNTLDGLLEYDEETEKYINIDDKAGVVWLAKIQGYSEEDVINAFNGEASSKFLKSLVSEVENCTTEMNAVTFLLTAELKDLFEYKKGESVDVPKGTICGLYDPWNGAGGTFEIELEKAIKVPGKVIDSYSIDGARGYSIEKIFGSTLR